MVGDSREHEGGADSTREQQRLKTKMQLRAYKLYRDQEETAENNKKQQEQEL